MTNYFKYSLDPNDKNFDPIYITACFLDPIRNVIIYKAQTKIAIDHLKSRMNLEEGDAVEEDTPTNAAMMKGSKFLARRLLKNNNISNAKKSPFIRDIDRYKADSESIRAKLCSEATGDIDFLLEDPLDYWVREENKYETNIAQEAEDILCIPACSTSSERLFSVAGFMSAGRKINTKPDNLEKAVIVKTN